MDQYILDLIWFNIPELSYIGVTSDAIWQSKVYCVCYFICSVTDSHYLPVKTQTG